jgi:hypothetical protein
MFGRRLLVLVAILMGLTALAASLAPPPPEGRQGQSERRPSPAPPAGATGAPPIDGGGTVTAHLSAAPSAPPREVTAAHGDLVDLTVSGDVIDTVAISGMAVLEPMDPDSPARVELYADTPGRFPIRLVDGDRRIGTLLVTG